MMGMVENESGAVPPIHPRSDFLVEWVAGAFEIFFMVTGT